MEQNNELYHYGVMGMKWGQHKAARYERKAKKLSSKAENKMSTGKLLTAKAGEKYRKAAMLRSKAKDLRSDKKVTSKEMKKHAEEAYKNAHKKTKAYNQRVIDEKRTRDMSQDAKDAYSLKKKKLKELTNAELKKLNERQNLERNYKSLNPNAVSKGAKAVAASAAALGTIVALRKNGKQVLAMGKSAVNLVLRK